MEEAVGPTDGHARTLRSQHGLDPELFSGFKG